MFLDRNYEDKNSLELFITEIEKCIDLKMYLVALHMALSIPDILGKLQYKNLETGERYRRWFNENVRDSVSTLLYSDNILDIPDDFPRMNGTICYELRCKFFHQGINDINRKAVNSIDEFVLSLSDDLFVHGKNAGYIAQENDDGQLEYLNKYLYVSCKGLSLEIVEAAKTFVKKYPNLNYPTLRINNYGGKIDLLF